MIGTAPLPTLLSQLLVAFTIEFDNESEQRIRHHPGRDPGDGGGGPWLVSQAMWANFLRFVDGRDAPFEELKGAARMTNLAGLRRWGYLLVGPEPRQVVRLSAAGKRAAEIFRPLAGEIEGRWTRRFGTAEIAALRGALGTVLNHADRALPRYLPVAAVRRQGPARWWADVREDPARLDLSALLAQVLLLFTEAYDKAGGPSLPVAANALRVLRPGAGVAIRDLPRLAGVAREQIAGSVKLLDRVGMVVREPDPTGPGTRAVLTERGAAGQERYRRVVADVEDGWRDRFGNEVVDELGGALSAVHHWRDALSAGLRPYPGNWRANTAHPFRPTSLPHHPIVSARGGYPDGT